MRLAIFGLVAGLAMFATPVMAQSADPLAPAREGRLQCFEPNTSAKTCQALGGYVFQANGVIDNPAQVLISPSPAIVMRISNPVTVRNGAICGPLTAADVARATFTIDGAVASEADTTEIRSSLTQQLGQMFGQESCMTLTPDGDGFRSETTMGGVPQPQQTQHVIWVGANDGYRVAP
ncbi:MAG: hypothetical protein NT015_11205 [Alphaproteobacteria bacterium]|nr:hypothetical protein [Alphaproteobacteria bacterium]